VLAGAAQRGQQVGQRLAGAGASLDDEVALVRKALAIGI